MALVVEQDWRPKDLPPLAEAFAGNEQVTLFLPGMDHRDAWEFIPWNLNAPVIVDFSDDQRIHRMFVPGAN